MATEIRSFLSAPKDAPKGIEWMKSIFGHCSFSERVPKEDFGFERSVSTASNRMVKLGRRDTESGKKCKKSRRVDRAEQEDRKVNPIFVSL